MARNAAPAVLNGREPEPLLPSMPPAAIELPQPAIPAVVPGTPLMIEQPGGGVTIDFEPQVDRSEEKASKHNANLANHMDEMELATISMELLQGIEQDLQSSEEWRQTYAKGLDLLGFRIKDTNSASPGDAAPLEGMSRVDHPLLAEACLLFQANARGELLPASGPVKVRDDATSRPVTEDVPAGAPGAGTPSPVTEPVPGAAIPPMGVGGPGMPDGGMLQPQQLPSTSLPAPQPTGVPGPASPFPMLPPAQGLLAPQQEQVDYKREELANALEKDMNHFLTVIAKEYYPDSDRMFFNVGFGGIGIKKVYNCPLRRRPVSESIAMEDFIVSNALSDLSHAGRITHVIHMRPSVLKRMQLLGVYRDTKIDDPVSDDLSNAVRQAKANIQGVTSTPVDPKDADYRVYECYCELDIDKFAPRHFKGKGLPLPYKVTIEKNSQKVLEIRRNWKEDDKQCLPREFFVEFPYVKAFGFYGVGLLHILGNTTKTLTAAWRELIDAGMFANFPGFLFNKGAGRQLTNQFRVPPGGGVGLDTGLQSIKDAVMPLPYKDIGPAFTQFITHVSEYSQRLAGTSNIEVGEGRQDAPVGTTLALIEQASKGIGAVLKRLHASQAREFQLLKERFKDDPESFWRFNPRASMPWSKEMFLQAINDFDLVPVSDPNNPTRLHRAAKGEIVRGLATAVPGAFDIPKTIMYVAQANEIEDMEDLLKTPEQLAQEAEQGEPLDEIKAGELHLKAQKVALDTKTALQKQAMETQRQELENAQQMREVAGRMRIMGMQLEMKKLELATAMAQNAQNIEAKERELILKIMGEQQKLGAQTDADIMKSERQFQIDAEREDRQTMRDGQREQQQMMIEHARDQQDKQIDLEKEERKSQMEIIKEDRKARLEIEKLERQAAHDKELAAMDRDARKEEAKERAKVAAKKQATKPKPKSSKGAKK